MSSVTSPASLAIKVNDAFVVKYEHAARQRHLPLHTDQSVLSLTIALNSSEGEDTGEEVEEAGSREGGAGSEVRYRGGGTFFESLGRAMVPVKGGLVSFPGDLSHGGMQITGGVRYIIACFLYVAHDGDGE